MRGAKLGQFSGTVWSKICRVRTNVVQSTGVNGDKSLILKGSVTGTVNALRPRLKPFPRGSKTMKPADVIKLIKDKEVKYADLRFTDTRGKEQHVTIPSKLVDEELFRDGKMFDGSSISGWKGINESDMILALDPTTAVIDPFFEQTTVNIRCDIIEPATMQGYERDPRSLGKRTEAYLKSTGIADGALFGPENEFFISTASAGTAA